ncbi:MAG: DUF3810 family protein [Saprospiraceae bacterium]
MSSLFILPENIVEKVYGGIVFQVVRLIFNLLSFIPFPLIYLEIAGILFLIWRLFKSTIPLKNKGIKMLIGIFAFILLFYVLWAFNYRRPSFSEKFPLQKVQMDSLAWFDELNFSIAGLKRSRPTHLINYNSSQVEELIRPNIQRLCNEFGYLAIGKARVKSLWPKGILLRIKTAGFYLPYAGEAYIDKGLISLQIPFTIGHEMCHGYGVTDEGACNLLSYLALFNHSDSTVSYSAQMGYYRYVAGEFRYHYPDVYQEIRAALPMEIQADLDNINANLMKYPDILPKVRDKIYNNYLNIQGIKEGMASYDNIIGYVRQYRLDGSLNDLLFKARLN